MKTVFISGIEVRLALRNRSDSLPVCHLRIGGRQIPVRIHRHYSFAPRGANVDRSRARSGPRPRSPVPESRAGPPAPRSPKDAQTPSSHRARSSEPLRPSPRRSVRRRQLRAPACQTALQCRCRSYRLSRRPPGLAAHLRHLQRGQAEHRRQHHDRDRRAAQMVVDTVSFPSRPSELPLLRP
jgi:hypothetical protein